MRARPYGPTAWLVEDVGDPAAWASGLTAAGVAGVTELVPAEDTVLVRCRPEARAAVAQVLAGIEPAPVESSSTRVVIDVRYEGADLVEVATRCGLSVDEVVELHAAAEFTVAFCGFSPGFAYLRGLPPELHLPRRATPRTTVPAGSVAVAAHYSAVYPSASPGGWHLLGATDAVVWDTAASPPTRLTPGTTVRFRAV